MKKWLRLGFGLALVASAGLAVDWKTRYAKPEGYLSYFAGVIDAGSKSQLEAYGRIVEQSTGAQMAFVTIPSLETEPIEDVANTLFRAWGVGQKGKNEGILLLLSVGDCKSRLEVGYGLEPILPDGLAGDILRSMRTALRQEDYGDAMMAAAQTMGDAIAKAKNVRLLAHLPPRRTRPVTSDGFPWPVLIGIFFLFSWLMRFVGPRGYGGFGGLPSLGAGRLEVFRILRIASEQDVGSQGAPGVADGRLNLGCINGGRIAKVANSVLQARGFHHFRIGKGGAEQHQRNHQAESAC